MSEDLVVADLEVLSNEACARAEGRGTSCGDWIYDDAVCTFTEGRDARSPVSSHFPTLRRTT